MIASSISPKSWCTVQTIKELVYLKHQRSYNCQEQCCSSPYRHIYRLCSQCTQLRRKMCSAYHVHERERLTSGTAHNEIALRLVYEYVFDIITIDDIEKGRWLHPSLRDEGHHKRMQVLYRKARRTMLEKTQSSYDWIGKFPNPILLFQQKLMNFYNF